MDYNNLDDLRELSGLSKEELSEISLKAQIVCEILNARKDKSITQRELEEISGVKQPLIARIESNKVDPQLTTILKILQPLGKTLAVVPIENN
jgi:predicted transcriptional regulator